ncbi:MAG: multidrug DMT transporter permease [Gemmatimonadota bacterium]
MTPTAAILILLSAGLHAGWNLLGKRQHPTAAFFLVTSVAGCVFLGPLAVLHAATLTAFPPAVWAMLAVTGSFQCLYYAALAGAYRTGHMSIAYPLARSAPLLVVTAVVLVMGKGDQVGWGCLAGMGLVVAGSFLLPMRRFGDLRLANYLNRSCLLALVAAVGTAGYSMVDDEALRRLRGTAGLDLGHTELVLLYAFLEAASSLAWLVLWVLVAPSERRALGAQVRRPGPALLAGAAIYVTYALVLVSMAFVSNVSYVVAFRQLSIPLGTVLGVVVLEEPAHVPKFAGVATISAGLMLVALG